MNKYQGTFKKDGAKKTLVVQAINWDVACKKLRAEFDKLGFQDWLMKDVSIFIKPGYLVELSPHKNRAQRRKEAHERRRDKSGQKPS